MRWTEHGREVGTRHAFHMEASRFLVNSVHRFSTLYAVTEQQGHSALFLHSALFDRREDSVKKRAELGEKVVMVLLKSPSFPWRGSATPYRKPRILIIPVHIAALFGTPQGRLTCRDP